MFIRLNYTGQLARTPYFVIAQLVPISNGTFDCKTEGGFSVFLSIAQVILGILAFFYISVLIVVLRQVKSTQCSYFINVMNLGFGDIFLIILVYPWVSLAQDEEYGLWVFLYMFQAMWYAIMLHTAFLAFTRLVTVFSTTISPDVLTLNTMLVASLGLWLLAFLLPIPMLIPDFTKDADLKDIHFNFFHLNKTFAIFDLIFKLSFLLFFTISYVAIFVFLHRHKKQAANSLSSDKPERAGGSRDTKILVQAAVISVCFSITQITSYSQRIIGACSTAYLNATIHFVFLTINPFVYLALSAQLRQMYYELYIKPLVKLGSN